ncbi:MAG: transcription termination/antitermination protein NusG [bacterium]
MALNWYIVHTYSGFEQRVKQLLEEKIKTNKLEQFFGEIIIPVEKVVEAGKGGKRLSSRKFYPGYILVQMELNDDTWHVVKSTPKVTGFVGPEKGIKPMPLSQEEVDRILSQMQEGIKKPKPKIDFVKGDTVRVIEGAFANFHGVVEEVNLDRGRLKVFVSIFGRSTPVEVDFHQVEKT